MQILVRNFQSIKEVKLNVKGFTLLVGESSQGKSATMRAIAAAVFNRFRSGQVRNGEERAEIGIKFDDESPVLKVVKPANESASMKLGNLEFKKLSRTVPSEVSELVNMENLSSDRDAYNLNFHKQFEPPLLLEFSQQKVMELLSSSEALDELNLLKGGLLDKRAANKGAFTSIDTILTKLKTEYSEIDGKIERQEPIANQLRDSYRAYSALNEKLDTLYLIEDIHANLSTSEGKAAKLQKILDFLNPDHQEKLSKVDELLSLRGDVQEGLSRAKVLKKNIEILTKICEVQDEISRIEKKIHVVDLISTTEEHLKVLQDRQVEVDAVVNKGICPICGNKIEECKDYE